MQTPAAGLTHDWLTRLIGYSNQPEIAAAGPILLAPDGRIQQAGIAIPDGIPLHLLHGMRSSMDNFFGYGTSVYNVSAVSGVLATRRDIYDGLAASTRSSGTSALDRLLPARDRRRPARRHRPRRPPARHRPRHHHQRPPGDLATAPSLGPNAQPRSVLQPQLPHRPRRLRAHPGLTPMIASRSEWPPLASRGHRGGACRRPAGCRCRRCGRGSTRGRRGRAGCFIPTGCSVARCWSAPGRRSPCR